MKFEKKMAQILKQEVYCESGKLKHLINDKKMEAYIKSLEDKEVLYNFGHFNVEEFYKEEVDDSMDSTEKRTIDDINDTGYCSGCSLPHEACRCFA